MRKILTGAVLLLLNFLLSIGNPSWTQSTEKDLLNEAVSGLKLRGIGPAVMGGRIADIAVNPDNPNNWYIAVGSGGLWKTNNQGITWTPVFDSQPSYSIGTVALDPNNPNVVWVGTGENVSGRHVGWGDGVYRSVDAGATWQQMGLPDSEHIGKILIDPRITAMWCSWRRKGHYGLREGNADCLKRKTAEKPGSRHCKLTRIPE